MIARFTMGTMWYVYVSRKKNNHGVMKKRKGNQSPQCKKGGRIPSASVKFLAFAIIKGRMDRSRGCRCLKTLRRVKK